VCSIWRVARTFVSVVGGVVGGVVLGVLALAAVGGVVLLVLWIREPSASADARSHVQSLFVDGARRTGHVTGCTDRGAVQPDSDEHIWACRVIGNRCARTYRFLVRPAEGAEPYDPRFDVATTDPCARPSNPAESLPGGLKH
jgi:hypothetical protein